MRDVLYTSDDIPSEFKFARFGSNYIDLFNQQTLQNGTFRYYRVYLYDNYYTFDVGTYTVNQYNSITLTEIPTSHDFMYRRDIDSIFVCVFIFSLFFIFLCNIFTSIVKKGGAFGGLL